MAENAKGPVDEKLLILPLGEESKKITQVISNDTAREVIELLADAPLSASDIAERLKIPLTTVAYNLENLENVGLVRIEKIKYSEKGREVKIYAPVKKLIVVVPEKTDRKSVAQVLRKYMGTILAAFVVSGFIEFLLRRRQMQISSDIIPAVQSNPHISAVANETTNDLGVLVSTPIATSSEVQSIQSATSMQNNTLLPQTLIANVTPVPTPFHAGALDNSSTGQTSHEFFKAVANAITAHPGLLFLMGCLFVISIVILIEYRGKR